MSLLPVGQTEEKLEKEEGKMKPYNENIKRRKKEHLFALETL